MLNFVRNLSRTSYYPRFHIYLFLPFQANSSDMNLYTELRPHKAKLSSLLLQDDSNEAQRILGSIERFPDSPGKDALRHAINTLSLFRLAKVFARYELTKGQPIDHNLRKNSLDGRLRGSAKSILKQRLRRAEEAALDDELNY